MDADGCVDPVMGFGIRNRSIELFRAGTYADSENRVHTGGAGTFEHSVAVFVELREIDARV